MFMIQLIQSKKVHKQKQQIKKKIRTKIYFQLQKFPQSSCWYSRWQEINRTKVGCPLSYMVFVQNLLKIHQMVHPLFALYQNRKCECRWSTYFMCLSCTCETRLLRSDLYVLIFSCYSCLNKPHLKNNAGVSYKITFTYN